MRPRRAVGLVLLVASLFSAPAPAQDAKDDVEVPAEILALDRPPVGPTTHVVAPPWQAARVQGIERLLKLARHDKSAAKLGFERAPVAADLTVLEPLPEALVQLEDLKTYQGGDAKALIKVLDRLSFPVLVKGKVRSSMTLSNVKGTWKPTSFGAAKLMRSAMRARIAGSRAKAGNNLVLNAGRAARYLLVNVTGLNQYFLAAEGPQGLYLIPLFDGRFGARGVPQKARDVLLKLVPEAKQHNGLPT